MFYIITETTIWVYDKNPSKPYLALLTEVKMNTTGLRDQQLGLLSNPLKIQRSILFGGLIILALIAFEIFNYSTTDFALRDLLGDLSFIGIRWGTILAIAFCGIDFAGIARLFSPDHGDSQTEIWYLFGAWMLAATMNAMLTWWGVSIAILNHETLGNAVVERQTLLRVVPIFVAIMVWLIRVLIIGTFSIAGEKLFVSSSTRTVTPRPRRAAVRSREAEQIPTAARSAMTQAATSARSSFRPAPKTMNQNDNGGYQRQEPTYHPASMDSVHDDNRNNVRRL